MRNTPLLHVVIALLVLGVAIAGYLGWYSVVENVSAKAAHLHDDLTLRQTETGRAAAAQEALGATQSSIGHFVSEKDVVPFLEEIQSIAAKAGAKTTVVSVAADENEADPAIRISLTVSGSFDTVLRALGLIEHSPYAISTQMFDLKADPASSNWSANAVFLVSTPLVATSTTP